MLQTSRLKFHNEGNSEWFWYMAQDAQQICFEYIENVAAIQGEGRLATFTADSYYLDNETPLIAYESDLVSFFGKPIAVNEGELPW